MDRLKSLRQTKGPAEITTPVIIHEFVQTSLKAIPNELQSKLVLRRSAEKFEQMKKEGKSPFMNYSLPQAVIRFKQGFGRLIRSKSDRGAIFIFDNRITRTAYGYHFLHSLPKVQVVQKTFSNILLDYKEWWNEKT